MRCWRYIVVMPQPQLTTFFASAKPLSASATASSEESGARPVKKKDEEPAAHPIQAHLRELTTSDRLPKVDEDGIAFTSEKGKTGKASKNSRTHYSDTSLKKYLAKLLPECPMPMHTVDPPRKRADKHQIGTFWTRDDMKKACDEFSIPSGMKVIFICPELLIAIF